VLQSLAQIANGDLRSRMGNHVAHETLLAGNILASRHGAFAHKRELAQCSLDFAEFDAVTANFDLMIDAPQKLNVARPPNTSPDRRSCKGGLPARG